MLRTRSACHLCFLVEGVSVAFEDERVLRETLNGQDEEISEVVPAGGGSNQTTIGTTFQLYRLNFSSDPNVNNNPKFKVKIAFSNNNVWLPTSTSGNDRFDNVTLSGVRQ